MRLSTVQRAVEVSQNLQLASESDLHVELVEGEIFGALGADERQSVLPSNRPLLVPDDERASFVPPPPDDEESFDEDDIPNPPSPPDL